MRDAVEQEFARRRHPSALERLRQVLLGPMLRPPESTFADKIAAALEDGPLTAPEIGKKVTRRREAVEEVLEADARFVRVPPPPGRSKRAVTFGLAPQAVGRVGTNDSSGQSEAA
jgi:hypothetical protein